MVSVLRRRNSSPTSARSAIVSDISQPLPHWRTLASLTCECAGYFVCAMELRFPNIFFSRAHMLKRDLLQGTSDEIFQVK